VRKNLPPKLSSGPGQRDGERGPVPLSTLHGELPPVRRHNFLRNVQPQPGPPGLGRIQRLKNLRQQRGWNATPRILDLHLGGRALPCERQPPPRGMASSAFCTRFSTARRNVVA
jgi:hypothetical protein